MKRFFLLLLIGCNSAPRPKPQNIPNGMRNAILTKHCKTEVVDHSSYTSCNDGTQITCDYYNKVAVCTNWQTGQSTIINHDAKDWTDTNAETHNLPNWGDPR